MIKKGRICIFMLISVMVLSCASSSGSQARWDVSPDAMRQVFPDSRYIASQGRGATREAAEADGASQVARFFNTEVNTRLYAMDVFIERNGVGQTISEIEMETFIGSQMNLFGIRYATDAYFDRQHSEWVTVAYINRNEAWQVYMPRFRQQAEAFNQLLIAAERETDHFRKVLRFMSVQDYARSSDFHNNEIIGQVLHPTRMNEEFAVVRSQKARLPRLLDEARRNAPIYIDVPADFESLISNAFVREFGALGFPVVDNREMAVAVCSVTITEGRQERELGIFYHPSLQAVISSSMGVLITISIEGERTGAVTPDVAKRRAYQSLVEGLRGSFLVNNE